MSTERRRDNQHKFKDKKFHLNIRENIFTVGMVEHWNRFPREPAESVFLELIEHLAGYGPEKLAVSDPALSRGHGLDALQRSFPTSAEFF